jgi:DNA polymerase IV
VAALGKASGAHLHRLANGIDDRPVQPDVRPKSVSHEETYPTDLVDPDRITREVVRQADAVAARLRALGMSGRTVTVKVRYPDFRTLTRSATLTAPVDTGPQIARPAKRLLAELDLRSGVRLLGVGVTGLGDGSQQQLSFDAPGTGWDDASRAIDRIRARYGAAAIGPAVAAGPDGIRVVERGAQQWGPDRDAGD